MLGRYDAAVSVDVARLHGIIPILAETCMVRMHIETPLLLNKRTVGIYPNLPHSPIIVLLIATSLESQLCSLHSRLRLVPPTTITLWSYSHCLKLLLCAHST